MGATNCLLAKSIEGERGIFFFYLLFLPFYSKKVHIEQKLLNVLWQACLRLFCVDILIFSINLEAKT